MENQPSHDELRRTRSQQLRTELTRRGLPRAYIERLVSELDDHLLDLLEVRNSTMGAARKLQIESDEAQERLGEPTQLAIFAADQYHSRTFWGRHPSVTFVLGPLPLLVAMWTTYVLTVWILLLCRAYLGSGMTDWTISFEQNFWLEAISLALFSWGLLVLPPLAAALLLCRVYRRNALRVRWPLVGCIILAVFAAALQLSWRLATGTGDGQSGMYSVGLNFHFSPQWIVLTYLPKFALAFGIGMLLIQRARQQLRVESASS